MIWLRHELWENHDGPSYRLANRTESAVHSATHPDSVLKHVFYAPSPAAAEAQYHALRGLAGHIPGAGISQQGFSRDQLDTQLAEFPEDATLAAQPALHPHAEASAAQAVAPIADPGPPVAPVEKAMAPAPAAPEPAEAVIHEAAHPVSVAEVEHPAPLAVQPLAAESVGAAPQVAEPAAGPTAAYDPLDLWPVAVDEVPAPRWARRRKRRPNVLLVVLRILILLIVLAAVVVGIGIVTGVLDGPALLAQVRDLSIVRRVLPSA